jgi:AcrR family transcriptional regulator
MSGPTGERREIETSPVARSTPKAEETRRRILESAMGLFRERGFEPTTMRDIASQAGVAIGAAYYYFDSKEALVIAFYQQAKDEMNQQIQAALAESKDLRTRLQAVIEVKFRFFAPSRNFLGALFRHAADPDDPLSPFSEQTRDIRELDIQHFAEAMNASDIQPPDDLRPHLPKLLWLYQMGLILFWIYDRSPEQARTRLLLAKSLAIVTAAIKLARLPMIRPLRRSVIELLNGIA